MATIAQPSGPELTAASDAMDIHSDSGYDLGDGDIDFEIEFELTTGTQGQDDDDLSLHDAAPDAGLDLQTTLPDQDDFMADKDDVIEEDDIDYNDIEVVDAGQSLLNSPAIVNEATIDDDLIDYSDDEDEPPQIVQEAAPHADEDLQEQKAPAELTDIQPTVDHGPAETLDQTADEYQEFECKEAENDTVQQLDLTADQSWDDVPDQVWREHDSDSVKVDTIKDSEAHEQQPGGQDHNDGSHVDQPLYLEDTVEKGTSPENDQTSLEEYDAEVSQALQSHSITINYDGSEYWLFKPDESENDDDWLLSDPSFAKQNLLFLFQACRTALHGEIGDETEMGFRFDNFHNMDLFEDSTACLSTTLGELLTLYLKLHAQDGTISPESFYITLQFRPRVSALIDELRKAVQNETGYSGLNTAIAAGQTTFTTPYSNQHSDDEYEHWDENQKSEHADETAEQDEHYEKAEEVVSLELPHEENEQEQQEEEENTNSVSHTDHLETHSVGAENAGSNEDGHQTRDAQETTATPSIKGQTLATNDSIENDGDIIDYSDDEESTDAAQPGQASVHHPSSRSSTVQGNDELYANVNVQDPTNPTEPLDNRQPGYTHDEGFGDDQDEQGANAELKADFANYEEGAGADATFHNQAFDEDYGEAYDQDTSGQGFEAGDYSVQDANAADDGYYYEDAGADQHEDLNFPEAADDELNLGVSGQAVAGDQFADVDDTFDFNAGETAALDEASHSRREVGFNDVIEDDYINYDDEEDEDGTVEQPTVATSAAVQPVAASSTGLDHEGSPQGLKRSIDEVDNGPDISTDLSDSKRPRV